MHNTRSMSPRLTSDGHFKIPSQRIAVSRPESRNQADQPPSLSADYIIAQQTRSKVSLATTPIEIIEANFQPPDVDSAENVDCSITSEYMQFLKDTICKMFSTARLPNGSAVFVDVVCALVCVRVFILQFQVADSQILVDEDDADDDEDFLLPCSDTPGEFRHDYDSAFVLLTSGVVFGAQLPIARRCTIGRFRRRSASICLTICSATSTAPA